MECARSAKATAGSAVADEVVDLGVASGDISGNGSAEVWTGDFEFSDLLVQAVDVEALVKLGHAAIREIDDHEAEILPHPNNAA